jgi:peptidyl-prolyl cis-trans isomerase SurA
VRAFLVLLLLAGTAAAAPVDRVVAIINDTVILQSELAARMEPLRRDAQQIVDPKERQRRIDKLEGQMLDELVADELIVQAAHDAKLDVTPAELKLALDAIKREHHLSDAELDKALADQGMSRASIKNDVLRQRAINTVIGPKVKVTDEDVQTAYDAAARRNDNVKAVRLAHILFALPAKAPDAELAAARARAQAALDRLDAGEEFAAVARDTSDDAGTKATGGELGWFENGKASTEWDNVIFAMAKGETRGPVRDAKGLHLLHVVAVKAVALEPFAKLAPALRQDLEQREQGKLVRGWVEELRKKAYIVIKL